MLTVTVPASDESQPSITVRKDSLFSNVLHRAVELTLLLPPGYDKKGGPCKVLYLNDGQDIERLALQGILQKISHRGHIQPFVVVGIHANQDRLSEYGTASQPDYKGRGAKAGAYSQFVLTELMPYIERTLRVASGPTNTVIAGFSLGGLSALDLAWAHPERFGKVGVFSGSLWWRKKAYEDGYDDLTDRIMPVLIRSDSRPKFPLRFWFEAGTNDETSDRNKNGVIDAIDDTLDVMKELEKKGYRRNLDFTYVEVPGGRHNQETWAGVLPDFLIWAFGR